MSGRSVGDIVADLRVSTDYRGGLVYEAADLLERIDALRQRLETALEFYADPETYFACGFWFDSPTGGFDDDFSEDDITHDSDFDRPMPGKLAREALGWAP